MTTMARGQGIAGWRLAMWGAVAALLLAPLVAMRFTAGVNWTPFDFAAAAVMLGGAALAFEVAVRLIASRRGRVVAGAGIVTALVLLWLQGAVGLV